MNENQREMNKQKKRIQPSTAKSQICRLIICALAIKLKKHQKDGGKHCQSNQHETAQHRFLQGRVLIAKSFFHTAI